MATDTVEEYGLPTVPLGIGVEDVMVIDAVCETVKFTTRVGAFAPLSRDAKCLAVRSTFSLRLISSQPKLFSGLLTQACTLDTSVGVEAKV